MYIMLDKKRPVKVERRSGLGKFPQLCHVQNRGIASSVSGWEVAAERKIPVELRICDDVSLPLSSEGLLCGKRTFYCQRRNKI